VTSVDATEPSEIAIDLLDERGTDWRLSLRIESPGAQIGGLIFERPLAAGIRIEQALDDPPLNDMIAVERAVAIEAGAHTQSIDRIRSLTDHLRLVDHVFSTVACDGDKAVAMSMAIFRSVTDPAGDTQIVLYGGRNRVHPNHRGRRLSASLMTNRSGKLPQFDGQYFLVDPDNEASMALVSDHVQRLGVVIRFARSRVPLAR
jgi:predicted N-acetyltransferase YhbS